MQARRGTPAVGLLGMFIVAACGGNDSAATSDTVDATTGRGGSGGREDTAGGGRPATGGTAPTGGAGGTPASSGGVGPSGGTGGIADAGVPEAEAELPPCGNGLLDGAEEGIDCGFAACARACIGGSACAVDSECTTDLCHAGRCAIPLTGVHPNDLVLDDVSTPYVLLGDVQVGGELSIHPGVTVLGNGFGFRAIAVIAVGTCDQRIVLNDVILDPGSTESAAPAIVELTFADFFGGQFLPPGDLRYYLLTVRDCRFTGLTDTIRLWNQPGPTFVERNVFVDTEGINIRLWTVEPNDLHLAWNYFEGVTSAVYDGFINLRGDILSGSRAVVEYNTFAEPGVPTLSYMYASADNMVASNNYWGTTDPAVMAQMIHDGNDDIDLQIIPFEPFLAAPDPATPGRDGVSPRCGTQDGGSASDAGGASNVDASTGVDGGGSQIDSGGGALLGACDQIACASTCWEHYRLQTGATLASTQSACETTGGTWVSTCTTAALVGRCEADDLLGHRIYSYYSTGGSPLTSQAVDQYCSAQGWPRLE